MQHNVTHVTATFGLHTAESIQGSGAAEIDNRAEQDSFLLMLQEAGSNPSILYSCGGIDDEANYIHRALSRVVHTPAQMILNNLTRKSAAD